ncbi:serine O-acetyltransferase [Liquorilactobacillus satsumensis]|uniref:serine O-acetyltransferase n=1 Tax=Liquorilactobacillus satsumensis TaxID=259059 RepID=UPI001E5F9876|nr:serine O-acetyltransferase [Liquorilactobacillus satsumensis]
MEFKTYLKHKCSFKKIRLLREEVKMIRAYDPAVTSTAEVLLTYSGLHAVWLYRLSHHLWCRHHCLSAQLVTQISRLFTGVEIHPGAKIGKRLLIDHGTGIVIGETAKIGNDVVLYHGVTLGSIANHGSSRHPKIGNRVFIGAGATILGAVTINDDVKVGAAAVVLHDVPAGKTIVGNPGHIC